MNRLAGIVGMVAIATLCSCGGGGGGSSGSAPPAPPQTSVADAEVKLLFMGNSHTGVNNVPDLVAQMVRAARPGHTAAAAEAPEWLFLGDRATDPVSLQLLRSQPWSFVVLQAQEYSSSGQFTYPTDGAEALVRMASEQHAVPILFPEWPRRGINESQRIYGLHASIAQKQAACVAPIPQAFDVAIVRTPDINLWADDGNHSSLQGAFLASLVIATTMTLVAPDQLPYLPSVGLDSMVQQRLRTVAAEAIAANPPRLLCPNALVPS
jgi:hypothetical protein